MTDSAAQITLDDAPLPHARAARVLADLERAISRAEALTQRLVARAEIGAPRTELPPPVTYALAKEQVLRRFETRYVAALMRVHDGNISRAARKAGMDRSNFKRLLRK